MARHETDKEDLICDATALVQRAELQCAVLDVTITIGFFRDGRGTIYFDQDPFYQFGSDGRLRRAFEDGLLFRSQGTTLARLDRHRTSTEPSGQVTLQRSDLSPEELKEFRQRMSQRIARLQSTILDGQFTILRAVTPDGGLPEGTQTLLEHVLGHGENFLSAPPGTR